MPRGADSSEETKLRARLAGHDLLLYDGVCGLCNRVVRFVLRHDTGGRFRFLALQDPLAEAILARHEIRAADLASVALLVEPFAASERLCLRSEAVVEVLARLGGGWRVLAAMLRIAPRPLRDFAYGWIARWRYRIFGRFDACPIPPEGWRERFLGNHATAQPPQC